MCSSFMIFGRIMSQSINSSENYLSLIRNNRIVSQGLILKIFIKHVGYLLDNIEKFKYSWKRLK